MLTLIEQLLPARFCAYRNRDVTLTNWLVSHPAFLEMAQDRPTVDRPICQTQADPVERTREYSPRKIKFRSRPTGKGYQLTIFRSMARASTVKRGAAPRSSRPVRRVLRKLR